MATRRSGKYEHCQAYTEPTYAAHDKTDDKGDDVSMMSWGQHYWPVFLSVSGLWVLSGFGIPESLALVSGTSSHFDNTLSFYARTELHVSIATANTMHTPVWWISFLAWMMFVVFITAHIWFAQFG